MAIRGTFGRFNYFPALGTYALVNDSDENAYTLRMTSAPTGVAWFVDGGGSISASGLFTAGNTPGGPFNVSARIGSVAGASAGYGHRFGARSGNQPDPQSGCSGGFRDDERFGGDANFSACGLYR